MWGHVFVVSIRVRTHWTILTFIICPHCSWTLSVWDLHTFVFCSQPLITSSTLFSRVFPCSLFCSCLQFNASTLVWSNAPLVCLSLLIYIRHPELIIGWVLRNFFCPLHSSGFCLFGIGWGDHFEVVWSVSLSLAIFICTIGASSVSFTHNCFSARVIPGHNFTLSSMFLELFAIPSSTPTSYLIVCLCNVFVTSCLLVHPLHCLS